MASSFFMFTGYRFYVYRIQMEYRISEKVALAAPELKEVIVEADIENGPTPDGLWAEIEKEETRIHDTMKMEWINKIPAVAAIRKAYKALGKEPNRYRPSSEALMRRCVKGLGLYRSLTVIDLINLLSLKYGHSIGGFDRDKIEGEALVLGVGEKDEPYEGIGRGPLNIECLPVYRDAAGGVGTPTSDNERTKLTPDTRRLVMTIHLFDGEGEEEIKEEVTRLLTSYAAGKNIIFREGVREGEV